MVVRDGRGFEYHSNYDYGGGGSSSSSSSSGSSGSSSRHADRESAALLSSFSSSSACSNASQYPALHTTPYPSPYLPPRHLPSSSSASSSPSMSPLVYSLLHYIVPLLLLLTVSSYVLAYYILREERVSSSAASLPSVGWRGGPSSYSLNVVSLPSSPFLPSSLLKSLPEHRARMPSLCGSWMVEYAAYHASVCSGDWFIESFRRNGSFPPPQLLVFHINMQRTTGGISDRWPILSTAMIVALLTRRVLLFDWQGHDAAYTHPHLPFISNTSWERLYHDWRWYDANVQTFRELQAKQTPPALWPRPPPVGPSSLPVNASHLLRGRTHDFKLTFENSDAAPTVADFRSLAEFRAVYPATVPVVFFASNYGGKGLTHYFFQSDALRHELEGMGLRQALCHGCLVNFLLGLNAEVQGLFADYAWQLVRKDVLTVGIQMRLGDVAMKGKGMLTEQQKRDTAWQDDDAELLKYADSFIHCAQQIVAVHREREEQQHLIFIVSDSARIRSLLAQRLNNTLIIPSTPPFTIGHTDTGDTNIFHPASILRRSEVRRYLQVAAGEQWLLAWCDFLVIDHQASGFGRSAALRSLRMGRAHDGRKFGVQCDSDHGTLTVNDWEKVGHKY